MVRSDHIVGKAIAKPIHILRIDGDGERNTLCIVSPIQNTPMAISPRKPSTIGRIERQLQDILFLAQHLIETPEQFRNAFARQC
jgi:hypothetical protein